MKPYQFKSMRESACELVVEHDMYVKLIIATPAKEFIIANPKWTQAIDKGKKIDTWGIGNEQTIVQVSSQEVEKEIRQWLTDAETYVKKKIAEDKAAREADRPAPYVDETRFFIYNLGCDTGLIYPEAERDVVEFALKNGAKPEMVYRGTRDKSRAFPGQYDSCIPASYVISGLAIGYESVWCEDVYAIPRADFDAAKAEIEKSKAEKKAVVDAKEAEKNAQEAAELVAMTLPQVATKLFTERIHVDEDGSFSTCQPYCDDCFWHSIWQKDVPQDVRDVSSKLDVSGKNGKVYTYRFASASASAYFASHHADVIEKVRAERLAQLRK